MFHSIPALLISGLILYLVFPDPDVVVRLLAGAGIAGILSHLRADELVLSTSMGVGIRLNRYAACTQADLAALPQC